MPITISCPKCRHVYEHDPKYTTSICPVCSESFAVTNTPRVHPGAPIVKARDPLLQEREKTHGDYKIQGAWAQQMKYHLRNTPNWKNMQGSKQESLDIIMTKISRILHGDADAKDHWDDIAGYAKLGAEACR